MNYWLMKTEPDTFGIDHLQARALSVGTGEPWDGVRNYQARNNMIAMRAGDLVLLYHSNADPSGVAGIAEIVREAYPDHTAQDPESKYYDPKATLDKPIWQMVDVGYVETFPRIVSLAEMKSATGLESMAVVQKGSRLSVTPVSKREFDLVKRLAAKPH